MFEKNDMEFEKSNLKTFIKTTPKERIIRLTIALASDSLEIGCGVHHRDFPPKSFPPETYFLRLGEINIT